MIQPNYPLDREISSRLLASADTSATALHVILAAAYGDDLYGDADTPELDPVLLWRLAREDFSVTIPEANENKINAIKTAVATDLFYEQEEAFVAICLALFNGDMGDMVEGFMEDITLQEALWGVFEVGLNRDDDMDFSVQVVRRIEREMEQEAQEGEHEFAYFQRGLIAGKSGIVSELRALDVAEEQLAQVRNFDETPIHDEAGNLLSPNGSVLIPAML